MSLLRQNCALAACAAAVLATLIGCGSSTVSTASPTPATGFAGPAISGRALAGTQPLIGSSVALYVAGSSGRGSGGALLIPQPITTDANGAFSFSGYQCPSAASELYAVATGGKPGASASANGAVVYFAAIGACNAAPSSIIVNEVTTVAGAYALAQFLSEAGNIGATSTNTVGLQNAFSTAAALANLSTGATPGTTFSSNGSSPAATINTLANVLNACAVSPGIACSTLFSATAQTGVSGPGTTLAALLRILLNPAKNVASLYSLAGSSSAFTPALATAPGDFTLSIDYSGGGLNQPTGLGVDSNGNIWVASYGNNANVFSPVGKPLFGTGITGFGLSASFGLAVDGSNNAWIPNEPSTGVVGNTVSVLNSSGQSVAGATGFSAGGLNYPIAVAIDTDASAWVVDYGNSHLTHLSSSGQALSGASGYTSTQLAFPVGIAVDAHHNVWVANQGNGTVTRMSPDGQQFTSFACCSGPANLAIDAAGNVWVANFYSDSISEISAAGIIVSSGYSGGGLNHPQAIAVDGAGNLWVANYRASVISEFAGASSTTASAGTPLSGTGLGSHAALRQSYAIVIDASGNIWVTNFGSNTLTEFVGLAAPVRTPLIGPATAP